MTLDACCSSRTSIWRRRRTTAALLTTRVSGATVEIVQANGLEIAYERVGEGPPLMFIHAAAEDSRIWR
jgi:hypothetical protein